jgi:hypothetical protein
MCDKEKQTLSRSIHEALRPLYVTLFSKLCKKARPRAAPMAIFSSMSQESGSGFTAQPKRSCI